ncbi:hypothetical protein HS088_TW13G01539 [Tripterygium wilfordii]|uniref:Structural constituent of ribosome n=1 Tax=Tripterygium wilfordii TaxID=458696 RepID=A0A7J7CXC0_TRIWF|nr:uncharacterized protein LOC120012067 [Tripterygium wilfordii]KAF5738638.1 hypothetical protein HS088_TW13G01539 [Tripterygium wilfordii]
MALMLLKRSTKLASFANRGVLSKIRGLCSRPSSNALDKEDLNIQPVPVDNIASTQPSYSSRFHLSPLLSDQMPSSGGYNIELVDQAAWQISSGLAHAWRGLGEEMQMKTVMEEGEDGRVDANLTSFEGDTDLDEIDNMRIRGNLFYKLDRGSKEFEEYSFDFHRRKSWNKDAPKASENKEMSKRKDDQKDKPIRDSPLKVERLPEVAKDKSVYSLIGEIDSSCAEKKRVRTPTFNQLTGPYHEPFCLDIYISKASVRACIIHRVTSKVVAVAHSISKDMKFDLDSTRNASACAAVGGILAQRALEDDIHDVVYTPRKGEKLEGKLQIVLQAIIDGGINLKVKLKQRKFKKTSLPSVAKQYCC